MSETVARPIDVTPDTRLRDLLRTYPQLVEFLASYRPEYEKLRNPLLRSTVGAVATLSTVAEMGDVPVDTLVRDIRVEIERMGEATAPVEMGEERRQELLKELIRELHEGASVGDVKARFDELIGEVGPDGIAGVEQALIAEGMPIEEIQRLCDVHVTVFKDALERQAEPTDEPTWPVGHPLDTFERENEHIIQITSRMGCSLGSLPTDHVAIRSITEDLHELGEVERHYLRKEHQLFPMLERHGISGPTKVMWAIHDDIRAMLKDVAAHADRGDEREVAASLPMLIKMMDDMVYKERRILFPLAAETLAEDEWRELAAGEDEIGYAWIEPVGEWEGAVEPPPSVGHTSEEIPLTTGLLTADQLDLMVRALPVDLTFVDEHDRVRFYSEGDRVFPRSPAIIGRAVVDCHPPKSVHVVQRIVQAFKDGAQDVAEFWLEHDGRFVHIRYIALRDSDGAYRGTLEVVQDATHVRELTGERRLLDW